MHLLVIRHGERRFGTLEHHDLGLTDRGRTQAQLLARWLDTDGARPHVLISSTLPRARETADILATGLALARHDEHRLREVGSCTPSGHPIPDDALPPRGFPPRDRPDDAVRPGSESWTQFRCRITALLRDVVREHGGARRRVALVCHGGVHNAIHEALNDLDRVSRVEWAVAHTGFTHLEYIPGATDTWILRGHNLTPHLTPVAGPNQPTHG